MMLGERLQGADLVPGPNLRDILNLAVAPLPRDDLNRRQRGRRLRRPLGQQTAAS